MKRIIVGIIMCVSISICFAQSNDTISVLEQRISAMEVMYNNEQLQMKKLKQTINLLKTDIENLTNQHDSSKNKISEILHHLDELANIQKDDRSIFKSNLAQANDSIKKNQTIVAERTLLASCIFIITILIIIIYLWRRKKMDSTTIGEIQKAQESLQNIQMKLQEESLKLDNKLLEVVEKQLNAASLQKVESNTEVDHSLAIKVADEIVRIEMNLARMDASVKGHKQLSKAVSRIKDNFNANGYEIVDMLGKPYNEGMKVIANFTPDENLPQGAQIITGIIKPQINYNGKMIQSAQITVSQNI